MIVIALIVTTLLFALAAFAFHLRGREIDNLHRVIQSNNEEKTRLKGKIYRLMDRIEDLETDLRYWRDLEQGPTNEELEATYRSLGVKQ